MKHTRSLLLCLMLSLSLAFLPTHASTRYTPQQFDNFSYHEIADLGSGSGDYTGYTEHTTTDGSEAMNTVYPNGTVAAHFAFTWYWSNSSGSSMSQSQSGDFTYSSTTFHYVHGTDNQTGYSNPYVWFYMDNSTTQGNTFYLLNTQMTVTSTDYNHNLPSQNRNVHSIRAEGSSSYFRNDVYGQFTATYTWTAYFDPSTGYIIGYEYVEHDTSATAGFTYTETLYVTQTSYQLATAPASSAVGVQSLGLIIAVLLGLFVILIVVVLAFTRIRRRPTLPEHPSHQQPWIPPQPIPQPSQGIDLTLKQQPPVQQIVVKEVVKVKCRYCGALFDGTAQACPFCGAPRT